MDFNPQCLNDITDEGQYEKIPDICKEQIKEKTASKLQRRVSLLVDESIWPLMENNENSNMAPVERVTEFLLKYVEYMTQKAETKPINENFKCFRTEFRAFYDKNSAEQGLHHLALEVLSLVEKIRTISVKVQEQTTTATSP